MHWQRKHSCGGDSQNLYRGKTYPLSGELIRSALRNFANIGVNSHPSRRFQQFRPTFPSSAIDADPSKITGGWAGGPHWKTQRSEGTALGLEPAPFDATPALFVIDCRQVRPREKTPIGGVALEPPSVSIYWEGRWIPKGPMTRGR